MPLRLRFAIWNATIIVGAICLLSALTYALEARSLAEDIDESLQSQAHNLTTVYQARATLPPRARERVVPQPSVFSAPAFYVQILDSDGGIVERSDSLGDRRLPLRATTLARARDGEDVFETIKIEGQNVRLFTTSLDEAQEEGLGFIQVARSLEAPEDALSFLRSTLFVAGAVLLVISVGVAWLLAGISLRPIGRITQAARDIALSGRLDRRLPPEGSRDEIARLVDTFNHMMNRIDSAFAAQRRFVADASHELRTPLTTIRGNLELLRRSGAVVRPEMVDALDDVTAEAARMSRLVHGLLALARADAGQALDRSPVRLDEVLRTVHREAQALPHRVAIELDRVDPVEVLGNADALKQLLLILVENSVKYTEEGAVALSLIREDGTAALRVRDTGSGIAPDDLPHIFERFYRSPTSRASGGTGLGLAIAQWIAAEHDATISVDTRLGEGTTFLIRLGAISLLARAEGEQASAGLPPENARQPSRALHTP
ncbi:MAG TPA: HAMP domain-containing sensor histidine kinase [Chloroflexota bacterium]|nr:HAMP domain-containing sensor histidine kinase [Chloroflexota bacterium]